MKGDPEGQLYNLKEDPQELNNRWNYEPELVAKVYKELNRIRNKSHLI